MFYGEMSSDANLSWCLEAVLIEFQGEVIPVSCWPRRIHLVTFLFGKYSVNLPFVPFSFSCFSVGHLTLNDWSLVSPL